MKFDNLPREQLVEELSEAQRLISELRDQISALKKIVEAKIEYEEKYNLFFSLSNDVMFTYDPNMKILNISPNVERLMGYKPEDLVGKYFYDLGLIHPEDLSDVLEDSFGALTREVIDYNIFRFISKDGKIIYSELGRIRFKHKNEIVEFIGIARDMTERIERERMILESRETARVLLDASNDTSLIMDTTGNIIAINESAAKRFGKTATDLLDTNILEHIPAWTSPHLRSVMYDVISSAQPVHIVIEPLGKPISIGLYPIRDAQGKVARIAANARDLSEKEE